MSPLSQENSWIGPAVKSNDEHATLVASLSDAGCVYHARSFSRSHLGYIISSHCTWSTSNKHLCEHAQLAQAISFSYCQLDLLFTTTKIIIA
jgi:hypothetical protein